MMRNSPRKTISRSTGSDDNAWLYALRMFAYRARSEKELRERLIRKGFSGPTIEQVVSRSRNSGYLDDKALVQSLMHHAVQNKLLGFTAARRLMLERGISKQDIDETFCYDEDREVVNARKALQKRLSGAGQMQDSDRRRLQGYLRRRGYSFDVIQKVFNGLRDSFEEEL